MFTNAMSFKRVGFASPIRKSKVSCTIEMTVGMIKFESARLERIRMRSAKDAMKKEKRKISRRR